ncbi:hypothetical protein G6F32_017033 [Rhizopus arrhizus]|nr:hypothetical protein G6F32_017033 [Rhizopus arrhizus]
MAGGIHGEDPARRLAAVREAGDPVLKQEGAPRHDPSPARPRRAGPFSPRRVLTRNGASSGWGFRRTAPCTRR